VPDILPQRLEGVPQAVAACWCCWSVASIILQTNDVAEAMSLGQLAASLISKKFPPPVKLEFEKVSGSS